MSLKNVRNQILGGCSALVIAVAMVGTAVSQNQQPICHATGSASNPYTLIAPSDGSYQAHFNNHFGPNGGDFFSSDGTCPGGGTTPTAVPEPITMLLFGAGLAGVGYAKRRMGSKNAE